MLTRNILLALAATSLGSIGCGLRSEATNPLADDDDLLATRDAGVEGREGSCTNPIPFTLEETTLRGFVHGGSLYADTCADGEGPEQVFAFTPAFSTDVTFFFVPDETDFTPTVRLTADGCSSGEGETWFCEPLPPGDSRSTPVFAHIQYTLAVDSPKGTAGHYALDISLAH